MKPKVKEATFGSITVGKTPYHYDIVIELNGAVRKRKKKLSKRLYGTSHKISRDEIEKIYQSGAKRLIVGTGHYDQVRLSLEAKDFLFGLGCEAILLPTPVAIKKWNKMAGQGKTIGLFHVTC